MGQGQYQFDTLSTREGFNVSLRHFNLVMDLIADFEDGVNLSDVINEMISEKEMEPEQIKSIINALLLDKYGYSYKSYNLADNFTDFDTIQQEVIKWHAADLVIVYYHPELGIMTINPKNPASWAATQSLKRNEFLVIFAGEFDKTSQDNQKVYIDIINKLISLLEGKKGKTPAAFTKGNCRYEPPEMEEPVLPAKPAPVEKKVPSRVAETKEKASAPEENQKPAHLLPDPEPTGTKMKMTPMYGITVTNELFHNGNVEAWKKIIESYEHAYPGLRVFVFYDGERINDINTLFKWGKVKRGTAIMISVAGENIQGVAKLKRYLMQGAGHMFESFLKGPPNKILKLF